MAQPEIVNKPKRWRRICWYSLAVVGLSLIGLYAFAFWRYDQQQAAIVEIERLGGWVVAEPGGPDWLRGMVGAQRMKVFDRVVVVDLKGTEITDDSLRHLSGMTNLEWLLDLRETQITDDGLHYLSGLTTLDHLVLSDTQITGDGLRHLSGMTGLESLYLDNMQITDDDLKHLSGLTNLGNLWLVNTHVTDEGERILQKALPNCLIIRQ